MSRDKIMDRIAKLLALAESPNLHEAHVAMARAQELMARHRIEMSEVESSDDDDTPIEMVVQAREATSAWRWRLLWALAKPNGCRPWEHYRDGRHHYVIYGPRASADTVRYMFALLERAIEDEVKRRRKTRELVGKTACTNFRDGAIAEIEKRLVAANKTAAAETDDATTALARLDDQGDAVQEWMRHQGWRYVSASSSSRAHFGGFGAGREFGGSVSLGGGAGGAVSSGPRAIGGAS